MTQQQPQPAKDDNNKIAVASLYSKTSLQTWARKKGFGFYRYDGSKNLARRLVECFIEETDKFLKEELKDDGDRWAFMQNLQYYLGGFYCITNDKIGLGYQPKYVPDDFRPELYFEKDDKGNIVPSRPEIPTRDLEDFLDHFTTIRKQMSSHPYGIGMNQLEKLIPYLKSIGYKFEITGESEYFPGHSVKVTFYKVPKVKRQNKKGTKEE